MEMIVMIKIKSYKIKLSVWIFYLLDYIIIVYIIHTINCYLSFYILWSWFIIQKEKDQESQHCRAWKKSRNVIYTDSGIKWILQKPSSIRQSKRQ